MIGEAGGRLIGGVWGSGAPLGIRLGYVLCQRRASTGCIKVPISPVWSHTLRALLVNWANRSSGF